eukprot:2984151-Prymnesium_polylepis.1
MLPSERFVRSGVKGLTPTPCPSRRPSTPPLFVRYHALTAAYLVARLLARSQICDHAPGAAPQPAGGGAGGILSESDGRLLICERVIDDHGRCEAQEAQQSPKYHACKYRQWRAEGSRTALPPCVSVGGLGLRARTPGAARATRWARHPVRTKFMRVY